MLVFCFSYEMMLSTWSWFLCNVETEFMFYFLLAWFIPRCYQDHRFHQLQCHLCHLPVFHVGSFLSVWRTSFSVCLSAYCSVGYIRPRVLYASTGWIPKLLSVCFLYLLCVCMHVCIHCVCVGTPKPGGGIGSCSSISSLRQGLSGEPTAGH